MFLAIIFYYWHNMWHLWYDFWFCHNSSTVHWICIHHHSYCWYCCCLLPLQFYFFWDNLQSCEHIYHKLLIIPNNHCWFASQLTLSNLTHSTSDAWPGWSTHHFLSYKSNFVNPSESIHTLWVDCPSHATWNQHLLLLELSQFHPFIWIDLQALWSKHWNHQLHFLCS